MIRMLFLCVVCSSTLLAYGSPLCGEYAVSAEWLYFHIGGDDLYFAADYKAGTETYNGTLYANNPTYQSGVRGELAYRCQEDIGFCLRSCYFPQFSYTTTVSGGRYIVLLGQSAAGASQVAATSQFNFFNVELLLDKETACFCPLKTTLEAGLQFLYLNQKNTCYYLLPDAISDTNYFNCYRRGIGPELGVRLEYGFLPSLALEMRALASLLVAKKQNHWYDVPNSFTQAPNDLTDNTLWTLIPVGDLSLGINGKKAVCWGGCPLLLTAAISYEFLYYSSALSQYANVGGTESFYNFFGYGTSLRVGACF